MNSFLFKAIKWFIIALFVLGTIPESVLSKDLSQKASKHSSIKIKYDLPVQADGAEEALNSDKEALASLKHAKSKKMKRDYEKTGDIRKLYTALNAAGEAIKFNSNISGYWITLGAIHSEFAKFNIPRADEYAENAFRQALELAPGDSVAMVLLAVNLAKTGECEEALDYFEKAITINILMLNASIAQWMNICYLTDAHTSRGILFFDNIQKQCPGYYYLGLYRAALYRAHFDYKNARSELTHLLNRGDIDGITKDMAEKLLADIGIDGEKN